MSIEKNLDEVRHRLIHASDRYSGHKRTATLIAVSKTIDPERIKEAYRYGQLDFAENRVQEWLTKKNQLPPQCRWHFIGRLQTNKVKHLDESIDLIHSLDRLSLLEALNREGEKRNHIWQTLLQINIAEDTTKAGLNPQEVPWFLDEAQKYPFVAVRGLMTIGKFNATDDATRAVFVSLRELRDSLLERGIAAKEQFTELSMGMSGDFEIALAEGATLVRVGSSIFGRRQKISI